MTRQRTRVLPASPAGHSVRAVVALDGSPLSKSALEPAAQLIAALAAPRRGTLYLLQVVDLPPTEGKWRSQAHIMPPCEYKPGTYHLTLMDRWNRGQGDRGTMSKRGADAMVAIERTAYPRMKRPPKAKELAELYTPTRKERDQAAATCRGEQSILSFLVLYKVFPARTSSPGQEGNRHLVPGQDTRLAPSG